MVLSSLFLKRLEYGHEIGYYAVHDDGMLIVENNG